MINLSHETEALLREKAERSGRTPDEVMREALSHAGDTLPWRGAEAPPPGHLTKDELIARMEAIALRSAARPAADARAIDEIIGYDDFGLPR